MPKVAGGRLGLNSMGSDPSREAAIARIQITEICTSFRLSALPIEPNLTVDALTWSTDQGCHARGQISVRQGIEMHTAMLSEAGRSAQEMMECGVKYPRHSLPIGMNQPRPKLGKRFKDELNLDVKR
jgi:hypothetical protein